MDDRDSVSSARFSDLKETLNTRFDGVNRQLDSIQAKLDDFETKDHAKAQSDSTDYRIKEVERQIEDADTKMDEYKSSIYRTVCVITSILSLVVSAISQISQFIN